MNNKYSLPKDGGLIEVSAPRDIIHRYEKIHTTDFMKTNTWACSTSPTPS